MIVYQAIKRDFIADCDNREIEEIITSKYLEQAGRHAHQAEVRSWKASLSEMARVLRDTDIPEDLGIGIEFGIPQTGKRIDFILSGASADEQPNLIIVELKQWSEAKLCPQDGIIIARRGGSAEREGTHPCYQAWSYAALLEGFSEPVYTRNIVLSPCAYLHNLNRPGI